MRHHVFSPTLHCWFCWYSCTVLFGLVMLPLVAPSLQSDFAKAFEHGTRVRSEGACHNPRPMVVYVNKTDPSKVYLPRGTILHRCSDLIGCCQNPSQKCEAIEMQTVELYFITLTLQVQSPHRHRRVRHSPKIEKILFTNHTQCGCRERNLDEYNYNLYDNEDLK